MGIALYIKNGEYTKTKRNMSHAYYTLGDPLVRFMLHKTFYIIIIIRITTKKDEM